MSAVVNTSLCAIGTPASGPSGSPAARLPSTALAAARARSAATCRNAFTRPSTALIRSRCAWVTSTAETSPAAIAAARLAAVCRVSSPSMSVLRQDARDTELAGLGRGRLVQRGGGADRRHDHVLAEHVGHRYGLGGRRDPVGCDLAHSGDRADDHIKLAGK